MKQNYQKILDETIAGIVKRKEEEGAGFRLPKLLLHACCAPCSSYTLEYLSGFFDITILFYNPNIAPEEEYRYRIGELKRLVKTMPMTNILGESVTVKIIEGRYDPKEFYEIAKGMEDLPEGGERCFRCYRLRLLEAAKIAAGMGADYFTTTLSISPYKNAEKLNEIGAELSAAFGVPYLFSDFKKKNGYRRSIELSKEYDLYRQDYCGCVYSKAARERFLKERAEGAEEQR